MKHLAFFSMLLAVTGVNLACRTLSGSADAARGPDRAEPTERTSRVDRPQNGDEAANLSRCAAEVGKPGGSGELLLARIAAECGNHLFEKALDQPDQPYLARLAQQHYRACLAHEPTSPDGAALFREVKGRMEQLDRLLSRRAQPAARKPAPAQPIVEKKPDVPAPSSPAPVEAPAELPTVPQTTGQEMVGPDGVIYRRSGS